MIRIFYKLYRKLLSIYFKISKKTPDNTKIENSYFNFIKIFVKKGSYTINDHKIYFDLNSDVTKRLVLEDDFEKFEIKKCLEVLNNNSIVLDIGANIGLHTVYFAQKSENGIVFAFEPSISTFKSLVNNTYSLYNIINLNFAVSEIIGISDFFVSEDDAYSSLKDTKRKKIIRIEKVVTYNLDFFFLPLNIKNVDLIKIDVEGFEYEVLKGMDKVINQYKPVIFVEIYKGLNSNNNPIETIQFLIDKNYKAFVCKENNLIKFSEHDDNFHNYFFFPDK